MRKRNEERDERQMRREKKDFERDQKKNTYLYKTMGGGVIFSICVLKI